MSIVGAGASKTLISGDGTNPGLTLGNGQKKINDHVSNLSVSRTKSAGIAADDVRLTLTGVTADHNEVGAFLADGSLNATRSSFSHSVTASVSDGLDGVGVFAAGATVSLTDTAEDSNAFAGVIAEQSFSAQASSTDRSSKMFADPANRLQRFGVATSQRVAAAPTVTVRDSSVSSNGGPGFAVFYLRAALTDDTLANNE